MSTPVLPPFPEEQARSVADWAVKLGVQAAADLVDQIRDWLGHPEKVTQVTRQWSPVVTGLIVDSGEGITEASANLGDYWEGRSQEGFDRYASHLQSVIGATRVAVDKVASTLTDSLSSIMDAYKAALDLIAECAKAILDALNAAPNLIEGVVQALITRNPLAFLDEALDAITKALKSFVDAVTNLAKSTIDIVNGYAQAGLKLESAASILPVPDNPPASLGDPDQWKVRPADDYDSPVPDIEPVPVPTAPTVPTVPPPGPGADNNGTPPPVTVAPTPQDPDRSGQGSKPPGGGTKGG